MVKQPIGGDNNNGVVPGSNLTLGDLTATNGVFNNSLAVNGDTTLKGSVTFNMDTNTLGALNNSPICVFEGDESTEPNTGISSDFVMRPNENVSLSGSVCV